MVDEDIAPLLRTCKKCGSVKQLDLFLMIYRSGNRSNVCKDCNKAYKKAWALKNADLHKDRAAPIGHIVCVRCDLVKPVNEFGFRSATKTGLDSACLACRQKGDKKRYLQSRSARLESAKWSGLKYRFGLTREEWFEKLLAQAGQCAICKISIEDTSAAKAEKNRRACVDHDHKTGKVRGLLCQRCNKGLGLFRDNVALVEAAAAYLKRYQQ